MQSNMQNCAIQKRKIVKKFFIRFQILRLKCNNSILARALSQAPLEELIAYSAPRPLADLMDLFLMAGRGSEEKGGMREKDKKLWERLCAVIKNSLEYVLQCRLIKVPIQRYLWSIDT